tara:strand:- start:305 stop:895 length:591 start_codon:yes stop_codon:yes gene_type:complete
MPSPPFGLVASSRRSFVTGRESAVSPATTAYLPSTRHSAGVSPSTTASSPGNENAPNAPASTPIWGPPPLVLAVTSAESVVADPINRDQIIRQRRGEQLPSGATLCTAFMLDVNREAEGLSYTIPVRFSRFERLYSELVRELPQLQPFLPTLPSKRGPFQIEKLLRQPTKPHIVEERTRRVLRILPIEHTAFPHSQ